MSEQANGTGQESGQGATGESQEGTGQQDQNGGQGTGQESGTGPASGDGFDLSKIEDPNLRAYLEHQQRDTAAARAEAARYRTELRAAQEAAQQAARANETDAQRLERERAEAEQERERLRNENRDLKVGSVVKALASTAQAFDADLIYSQIRDRIETDDQGKPTNADTLIADLKRTQPFLFRRTRSTADAGAGGGSPTLTMNDRIRGSLTGRRGTSQED